MGREAATAAAIPTDQSHPDPEIPGRPSVLMLVENLSVPFDRRVWQEATALRDAGCDVVVICPRGDDRDTESFTRIDGIEIHRYDPAPSRGGPLGYLKEYASAYVEIRRLCGRVGTTRGVDVVHAANPPDFLLFAARGLRRRGALFVFDMHDLAPELYRTRYGRRDPLYAALVALQRLALRSADLVIATNESYRRIAIERGASAGSVAVVRNGPDLERFRPQSPSEPLRRGKPFLIAYVGMIGPQDGVDAALFALRSLQRRRSDWHAVIAGSGDALPDMRALASTLGLDDVVEFVGLVDPDRVVEILAAADVCLAPEPSSPLNDASTMIKVGEYLAMARPVVAFDLPETRWTAGDAAAYAPSGDVAAFARLLAELLDDRGRRSEMGRIGRRRVEDALAWAHSRAALVDAYRATLHDRRAPNAL